MKNTLYPFFWQHGEKHEVLETYMEKIAESGMGGVCIEARPHPEFVKDGWWSDMECILGKAEELSMKVWILDDSHFPTGYANGKIKECYPQYLKRYLDMRRYDVHGPLRKARINLALLKGKLWDKPDFSEHILGVYMAERLMPVQREDDAIDVKSIVDITSGMDMQTRLLTVDIPEGDFSIFVVYETEKGGEEATKDYLNPLMKEATQVLIDEVYEPHYIHFKERFGTVIEGFFSDEPRFGNCKGTEARIGCCDMVLPWRPGLEKEIGIEEKYLPLLWVNAGGAEHQIRFHYMDVVTRLYHENFTGVLAKWCHDHGVWYLGHNIEDNGAHARLGYGTGHYFRGQAEMDFAGIDVIGGQIVPGMNYHHDAFNTGGSKGEFYHYALAKLASSAAHLDPAKKGRAMCEAFGAYGWNEGLKMMKWIADSLIVRGINYIVPHAFDPKKFPDFDCPPHFYAHGHNPQFRYFHYLSDYMNRMMEIMRDGKYPAKIGLLYPAELEWAGDCMPVEKPARVLTQNQISFDIVTADALENAACREGHYIICESEFEVLIVPYGKNLPEKIYTLIRSLQKNGVRVIFADKAPECMVPDLEVSEGAPEIIWDEAEVVELEALGQTLADYRCLHIHGEVPDLVVGEYQKGQKHYYMFFNENTARTIDVSITTGQSQLQQYDGYRNVASKVQEKDGMAQLKLAPGETVVWIADSVNNRPGYTEESEEISVPEDWNEQKLDGEWNVTFADSLSYPSFDKKIPLHNAGMIQELEGWENVCGTAKYETVFMADAAKKTVLSIDNAYETVEVFVNKRSTGVCLSKPYVFDLSGLLREGQNDLAIEVTNTLGTEVRDTISHYLPIEPFGLDGVIRLYQKEDKK